MSNQAAVTCAGHPVCGPASAPGSGEAGVDGGLPPAGGRDLAHRVAARSSQAITAALSASGGYLGDQAQARVVLGDAPPLGHRARPRSRSRHATCGPAGVLQAPPSWLRRPPRLGAPGHPCDHRDQVGGGQEEKMTFTSGFNGLEAVR